MSTDILTLAHSLRARPDFDEASLRKAASWQDFKEAQSPLNIGAVISSEKTADGWRGAVKVGTRVFLTSVAARTPTWLDAKCPCPSNQREGSFCPHAIAPGHRMADTPERPVAAKLPQRQAFGDTFPLRSRTSSSPFTV